MISSPPSTSSSSSGETHHASLLALADLIVPPDSFPGGAAAGCVAYLLRLLQTDLAEAAAFYSAGLDGLDQEAHAAHGAPFADLSRTGQEHLFRSTLRGDCHASWRVDPAVFCASLIHVMQEGYYADPGNGGNRDGTSWSMLGFEVSA